MIAKDMKSRWLNLSVSMVNLLLILLKNRFKMIQLLNKLSYRLNNSSKNSKKRFRKIIKMLRMKKNRGRRVQKKYQQR
jgi:hypothetical protein